MLSQDPQPLSPFGFTFTSPDYHKSSTSWKFVDPRLGNPTIDINTWNTITSDNYNTTIKNNSIRQTTKNDTTHLRKLQKLHKLVTNKIKRNRLNKYSTF